MFAKYAADRESDQEKKGKTVVAGMTHDTKIVKMMAAEHEMTIAAIIHELVQKHLEGVEK
jgi:hypothetical protein